MHYSTGHAISRLKKDKKIMINGKNAYNMFKEGCMEKKVRFTCLKRGKDCYSIKLYGGVKVA